MLVLIRGAGDIATGVALRFWRAGLDVVLTELEDPSSIRRTVCFSEAVRLGETRVEDACAVLAAGPEAAPAILKTGRIPVLRDPTLACLAALRPAALVDAVLAKYNTGTAMDAAPVVVGVGPGFTVGVDCHAAVETQRGHRLGRALYSGSPAANTGVPGDIGGYTTQRLLRSPCAGVFRAQAAIGDLVKAGDVAATVDGAPLRCAIGGVLRGLLPDGFAVPADFKCGDVDPRGQRENCYSVSDKALAVGGGALEAVLTLSGALGGGKTRKQE